MGQSSAIAIQKMADVPAATTSRIDQIDILRGISILAVVIHHINLRIPLNRTPVTYVLPAFLVSDLRWNGYNGVIIFFAISGFLITTNCLRRWKSLDRISLLRFYRLRFARIAPCLVGLLIVLSLLHVFHVPSYTIKAEGVSLPRAVLSALTFHVNWLEAEHGYLPGNWDVLWSLSNEEMFYIFFPLICVVTRKRSVLITSFFVFVALGPFARTIFSQNDLWQEYGYLSAMDAIAIGCLAAIAADKMPASIKTLRFARWTGIVLIVFITIFRIQVRQAGLYRVGLDVSLLALGTALVLFAAVQRPANGGRISAPLRWFGRNSYEVYLTHMMPVFAVIPLVRAYDPSFRWAVFWYAAIVALAGILGSLIARYYSEPMNRRLRA